MTTTMRYTEKSKRQEADMKIKNACPILPLVIFQRHPHHMLFKVSKWKKKIHPRVNRVNTVQERDPFKTSIQTLRYLSKKYRPNL